EPDGNDEWIWYEIHQCAGAPLRARFAAKAWYCHEGWQLKPEAKARIRIKVIFSRMTVRCNGAPLMNWSRVRDAICYVLFVVSLTSVVQWLAPDSGLMAQPAAEEPTVNLGCTRDGQ